jgi:hypothetical protein
VDDPVSIGEHSRKRNICDVLIQDPVHLTFPHRHLLRATWHEIEQTVAGIADRPRHAVFEEGDVGDRLLLSQSPPEDIAYVLQRLGGKEEAPSYGLRAIGTHHEIKLGGMTICEVHRYGIASEVGHGSDLLTLVVERIWDPAP